ncbi:MAG: hypothetical protein HUU47_07180 [Bacteroidetes bacterium]|nr:hypothetical protein [Bacteroidota bacterium]
MKIPIKKNIFKIFLVILLSLNSIKQTVNAQCPMCKAAVESSMKDKSNSKGKGLNRGILYLLAMPYLLAGVTGAGFYYRYKKRKRIIEE